MGEGGEGVVAGGGRRSSGCPAAVVSVNLCPFSTPAQDSSLTGITNMTPGHATLATVSQLSGSISCSLRDRGGQHSILTIILHPRPYCKYSLGHSGQ